MKLCELDNLLENHPYDLSGGEQQRVALAKMLLRKPDLLVLDEPTKGFDACFKRKLAMILKSLQKNGMTVLMVTHDIEFCAEYADICAMRHPKEGAPMVASAVSGIPVINAGDGGHAHPSQTMIDLMTIRQRKGRLDHLTIGFCGDLKFGRTVHSLTAALSQFEGNRFVFISPEELRIPQYVKDETLTPLHQNYKETADLEAELPGLDVLYMTRIQKERFFNEEDYLRLKGCYELDEKLLQVAPPTMPVLHPLPRIDEIKPDVDNDPRAAYFDQVHNGVYIRMAIILALLGIPDPLTGKKVLQR